MVIGAQRNEDVKLTVLKRKSLTLWLYCAIIGVKANDNRGGKAMKTKLNQFQRDVESIGRRDFISKELIQLRDFSYMNWPNGLTGLTALLEKRFAEVKMEDAAKVA